MSLFRCKTLIFFSIFIATTVHTVPATSISSVKVSFNFDKLLLLLLLLLYRKKTLFSASSSLYSLSRRSFRNNISFVNFCNFLTRRLAKARFAPNFSLFLSRKISIDSPSRNFSFGQVFLFTSFYLFIHLTPSI